MSKIWILNEYGCSHQIGHPTCSTQQSIKLYFTNKFPFSKGLHILYPLSTDFTASKQAIQHSIFWILLGEGSDLQLAVANTSWNSNAIMKLKIELTDCPLAKKKTWLIGYYTDSTKQCHNKLSALSLTSYIKYMFQIKRYLCELLLTFLFHFYWLLPLHHHFACSEYHNQTVMIHVTDEKLVMPWFEWGWE